MVRRAAWSGLALLVGGLSLGVITPCGCEPRPVSKSLPVVASASDPTDPSDAGRRTSDDHVLIDCAAGFRIVFPRDARVTDREDLEDGDGSRSQRVIALTFDASFSVKWGERSVAARRPSQVLADEVVGRLGATGVVDERREPVVLGGQALEITYHHDRDKDRDTPPGHVLFVLRGTTMFEVEVGGEAIAGSRREEATAFFSSFRLATCAR